MQGTIRAQIDIVLDPSSEHFNWNWNLCQTSEAPSLDMPAGKRNGTCHSSAIKSLMASASRPQELQLGQARGNARPRICRKLEFHAVPKCSAFALMFLFQHDISG